ncbi:MAG TPA: CvpA family protein [Chitinophagaceae bacterium]|nr:CvpA family protein [Chitinophagaceae bacterium]
MIIDIITLVLIAIAAWKGYSRGLIVAIFSFLAIIIGVAAAMKLSLLVAQWLQKNINIDGWWLPLLSFAIVMIAVILLVRWIANIIEASIELVLLGWLNRIGGIVFYILIFMAVYSVFLFYAAQMNLFKPEIINSSQTYAIIEPWGAKVINVVGYIIPFFKDMFTDLQNFFAGIADKVK